MTKKDTLDVLKKPVHAVVLKPHHLQELHRKGKLPSSGAVRSLPPQQTLPKAKKPVKKRYNPLAGFDMKSVAKPARDAMRKTRLTVLHNSLPSLPQNLQPPCTECKTSACCIAFVVSITKDEYESGYYEPYAVELDPQYMKQIKGSVLLPSTATSPVHGITDEAEYYLEGRLGEPCPFLENNRCSIYDQRPITCRIYTCVGDKRITQAMRDGTDTIFSELDAAVRISTLAKDNDD
jgi:Fe-S-cluster containining protein